MLHGLGDNETAWVQFGQLNMIVDKAIAAQQIVPMIIVMPDAGRSWYLNSYDGKVRYEDFFFQEFIPAIESTYRIRAEKRYRAIGGLSMGGYGSLIYSFRHPDMFAACLAFSAGIHAADDIAALPDEGWNSWNNFYGPVFGMDLKGAARLTEFWHSNSVLDLAAKLDKNKLSSVRYYLDCGDDDFLSKGNALLHITFRERDIYHEGRMRDGAHTWTYWRTGLKDGLAFISESFLQN
jgi:S-formylglutathione hydrolase FrmB